MKMLMGALCVFASCQMLAAADNWSNWRGPEGTGVAPAEDYPVRWSRTENIAWHIELPGVGSSTPIVWDDHIVLTLGADEKNWAVCFDRQGKEQWRVQLGEERPGKNRKASGSNPSPVTDGEHIFVYFKSGDFACLDWSGEVLWHRNLQDDYGEDTLWWDLGTSPVLTENHVVIACMHSGPSYVAAFDKGSGKTIWKTERNLDAPDEANQSYTTPVVTRYNDREVLVVVGADQITAYDAAKGDLLWYVEGLNPTQNGFFRSISSPVISGDLVVAPYARGTTLTAVRLGGEGNVTDSHVVWTSEAISSDVPTPAARDGKIYVLADKGEIACLDAETGKVIWQDRPLKGSNFSSSPFLVGNHLYGLREDGRAFVVELGDSPRLVAENDLGELIVASPVFVDGQILIRTEDSLFCISR